MALAYNYLFNSIRKNDTRENEDGSRRTMYVVVILSIIKFY